MSDASQSHDSSRPRSPGRRSRADHCRSRLPRSPNLRSRLPLPISVPALARPAGYECLPPPPALAQSAPCPPIPIAKALLHTRLSLVRQPALAIDSNQQRITVLDLVNSCPPSTYLISKHSTCNEPSIPICYTS